MYNRFVLILFCLSTASKETKSLLFFFFSFSLFLLFLFFSISFNCATRLFERLLSYKHSSFIFFGIKMIFFHIFETCSCRRSIDRSVRVSFLIIRFSFYLMIKVFNTMKSTNKFHHFIIRKH